MVEAEGTYRERNAMELFSFSFLALSTARTALFLQPLPPSLQSAPPWFGHAAVICLFLGCLGSLVGILWPDHDRGLVIEQSFLPFAGFGCFAYAIALATGPLSSAAIALGYSVGTGAFCAWRFVQIQRYVKYRRILSERLAGGEL